MALNSYLQRTYRLCNDQSQTNFVADDLISYINEGRQQIAAESGCLRAVLAFTTTAGKEVYLFSTFTVTAGLGLLAPVAVRNLYTSPATILANRPWEWYAQFNLANGISTAAIDTWSQFNPGVGGSLYLSPVPNNGQALSADCTMIPIPLTDDTTVEAIPFPWTNAIPYFAAYEAFNASMQVELADRMWGLYQREVLRSKTMSIAPRLATNSPIVNQPIGVSNGPK